MQNLVFLFAAYTVIWVALWGYTIMLGIKEKRLTEKAKRLESMLPKADASSDL